MSITLEFIYSIVIFSIVLSIVLILFAYRCSSKFTFKRPLLDLNASMLFTLVALFLSYRFVCEQWLIWILPFLILFCISGNLKSIYYWTASLGGLVYALLNCPLPFFLLPIEPWLGHGLLGMADYFLSFESLRITLLIALGLLFSAFFLMVLQKLKHLMKAYINS